MAKLKKAKKNSNNLPANTAKIKKQKKHLRGKKTGPEPALEKSHFIHTEVFSKPVQLAALFQGFREAEIEVDILRLRMQAQSVENGRGKGVVQNFSFRKFRDQPRGVLFISNPRGVSGGSFEPAEYLLKQGEKVQVSFTMPAEGAARPVYFIAKGFFLRKSYYIAGNHQDSGKPWTGPREEALAQFPRHVFVDGEDILQVRIDALTSFPNGSGSVPKEVLNHYLSGAVLYVLPGGGVWNQKSNQGNFFEGIQQELDKFLSRENIKKLQQVSLEEFANLGEISVSISEQLLAGVNHEVARPSVVKKPNDYLRDINASLGFLLSFKMNNDLKDAMGRLVPNKIGAEDEVYLPLFLDRVNDAQGKYRISFRLFPRDLIGNRGYRNSNLGLRFMPPYALHPGPENHNTYSKLLIVLSRRFQEDSKSEEDKLKSEKVIASVQQQIAAQRDKFVDEKVKLAFQERTALRKRRDENR